MAKITDNGFVDKARMLIFANQNNFSLMEENKYLRDHTILYMLPRNKNIMKK